MSYMALYRKWRPQTFDEVVEQQGVVTILKNAVLQNRIAHAYLFSGTRGTGKTTMAKIFARAVNCLHPVDGNPCNECEICRGILNRQILDVSEIDAASNNGVDNVRSIIDDSAYSSSVARYRVYIIDEVHMLSQGAFNALLKTLEEPPENVIFILATTEPHKLPVTVLSRCQRYEFKRISRDAIAARLRYICDQSGIDATDEALAFLAQKADGALRDGISLLDQTSAASQGKITLASARMATGSLDREFLWDFVRAVINSDSRRLLELSARISAEGRDPSVFIKELIEVLRNMMVVMSVPDPSSLIFEDSEGIAAFKKLSQGLRVREVAMLIRELSGLDNNLKWAVSRQIVFEAGILAAADRRWKEDTASLETRLSELEDRVADLMEKGIRVRAEAMPGEEADVSLEPEILTPPPVAERDDRTDPAAERTPEVAGRAPEEKSAEDATPETGTEALPGGQPEATPENRNETAGVRKLSSDEWKKIDGLMGERGQAPLQVWYNECQEQYLLPGNRLLLVFGDEMSVRILKKSSPTNLKVVNECMASVLGRPVEQIFALKKEAEVILDEAKKAAPATDRSFVTEPEPEAEVRPDDGFDEAVRFIDELSKKMNFPVKRV